MRAAVSTPAFALYVARILLEVEVGVIEADNPVSTKEVYVV